MSYVDKLYSSAESAGNIVCMGLDPVVSRLPYDGMEDGERIVKFFDTLFSKMASRNVKVAAFKPNLGFYSVLDRPREGKFSGSMALSRVLDMLSSYFPSVPVILDSKRGDIAKSSLNYAKEAFDIWGCDAVTVSPYMGLDSVEPFCFENKGVYVLTRTSNPGAKDFQNRLMLDSVDEKEIYPVYMQVAHMLAYWVNTRSGLGSVVGATNIKELEDIALYYNDKELPMLIPGVGSQGGTAPEVLDALKKCSYPYKLARINSSSGLTSPWKDSVPSDWLDLCISKIEKLCSEAQI